MDGNTRETTTFTSTFREETIEEYIREIIHYSRKLSETKWWKSKRYWKNRLKYYVNKYDEISCRLPDAKKK